MKNTLTLTGLILLCLGIIGCAAFRNGAPPTKVEQSLFTVVTNYVPVVSTVTNPPTSPGLPPTVVQQTNLQPTYTYSPGAGVDTVKTVTSLIPGYGGLAGTGVGLLAALWSWFRSSKSGATAATLAQSIETIREFVQKLPNGQVYDSALTTWLQAHQAETGTIQNVLQILDSEVSNDSAKIAADQILATIQSLNPSAVPPKQP